MRLGRLCVASWPIPIPIHASCLRHGLNQNPPVIHADRMRAIASGLAVPVLAGPAGSAGSGVLKVAHGVLCINTVFVS